MWGLFTLFREYECTSFRCAFSHGDMSTVKYMEYQSRRLSIPCLCKYRTTTCWRFPIQESLHAIFVWVWIWSCVYPNAFKIAAHWGWLLFEFPSGKSWLSLMRRLMLRLTLGRCGKMLMGFWHATPVFMAKLYLFHFWPLRKHQSWLTLVPRYFFHRPFLLNLIKSAGRQTGRQADDKDTWCPICRCHAE